MNVIRRTCSVLAVLGTVTLSATAQDARPRDGSLAVGGYGSPLPGGGYSYGFSYVYTPENPSYPLVYYGYGYPAYGPVGSPILGGTATLGYGYGFGYPAVGRVLSPVGGIGFLTYGYPVGSTYSAYNGQVTAPVGFVSVTPRSDFSVPRAPKASFPPVLPPSLTPLAVQPPLGQGALIDRIGVSSTFRSTGPATSVAPPPR